MTRTYTIYFLLDGAQRTHEISGDIAEAAAHVELASKLNARIQALKAVGARNVSVSMR